MSGKTKNTYRVQMGKWGEDCACVFLEGKGFVTIGRNIHNPYGEIDLVMAKEGKTFFVEVKTRANSANGFPEEAMTEQKIAHLDASVRWYLEQHPEVGDNWQVDVITVIGSPADRKQPVIDWWQDEL